MDLRLRLLTLALVPVVLSGCVSAKPQTAFDGFARVAAERSPLEAAWPRSADADAELEARARALLAAPLTPETAAQVALWRNRAWLGHLEELGISQADYAEAARPSNPSLELSRRTADEPGTSANLEATLLVSLLDPLLVPMRKRLAAAELAAVQLELTQELLDLVAESKSAVVVLQAAERKVERLSTILELAQAAAELARRQRAAGNLPQLELDEHEALEAETRIELGMAELEGVEARGELERLLGRLEAEPRWTVAPAEALPPPLGPSAELEALALARRPDLAAARFGVEAVERALAITRKTRWLPGLEIGFNRERELDRVRVSGPILELELPLFDQGGASVARLEAEARRANRQLEQLHVEVRSAVRELGERQRRLTEQARFYRETVLPGRARILDQTLRHHNMMLKGIYDVLLARRLELAAEKEALHAWAEAWAAHFQLENAVGGPLPTVGGAR
jgi:outer membrane protein, heavy metal efflux system